MSESPSIPLNNPNKTPLYNQPLEGVKTMAQLGIHSHSLTGSEPGAQCKHNAIDICLGDAGLRVGLGIWV